MFEDIRPRKGQPDHHLSEEEFKFLYKKRFRDPTFQPFARQIDDLAHIAWENYQDSRKAPITVKAGHDFADPDYDLSIEWLETRDRLLRAQKRHPFDPTRILLINGSPRNEHTCPGEISKTYRLIQKAEEVLKKKSVSYEILDLSELTSEFGKVIYPCKSCVSTAMPLCHWPCSCYPHHSLGQVSDWMADIYEMWVRAHGIMIITPVHWYQAPSVLKLMIDRLVCADGGNPDPTATHGKDITAAKRLEMAGWNYPKHLAGRAFSVVVHGDASGIENLRRNLVDWLADMELIPAGTHPGHEDYVGYNRPYATSHHSLDQNKAIFKEIENSVISLIRQVELIRHGQCEPANSGLVHPVQK